MCKVLYDLMGWEADYSFRIPCQILKNPDPDAKVGAILAFDLDNYIGRAMSRKDEVIIAQKATELATEPKDEAKSFYYPPDEEEPQEIRDMEEKFQKAVELNKKIFGTPVFLHESGIRGLDSEGSGDTWDMLVEARPLDITHTVDAAMVDGLLQEIREDPPVLPLQRDPMQDGAIEAVCMVKEEV